MRILPYELYEYAPDLSLCALRKEFGIYDYCLNNNTKNKAMQPFLDMGRNYFNLSIKKWILEMQKRNNYVNTFHLFYANNNLYQNQKTNFILILECLIQWDIKGFIPYLSNLSWFGISLKLISIQTKEVFSKEIYYQLFAWYNNRFMQLNQGGKLKPKNLNMLEVITFFNQFLIK